MKAGLHLRASQQLALTPQLQQSIRLLQLSTLELVSEVEQMLDDNPFLERADDASEPDHANLNRPDSSDRETDPTEADGSEPESWADAANLDFDTGTRHGIDTEPELDLPPEDSPWSSAPSETNSPTDDDGLDPGAQHAPQESLHEHLHHQARALRLSPEDAAALHFLIESLDEHGYLEDSLAQLAAGLLGDSTEDDDDDLELLQELVHRFTLALHLLQSMEPTGVGARNLAECLSLQLKALRHETLASNLHAPVEGNPNARAIGHALTLLAHPDALELLARRDVRGMARTIGCDEDSAQAVGTLIARLEPRPGRRFATLEHHLIVPDILVSLQHDSQGAPRLSVQLNPEVMPRLRVHELYARTLRSARASEGHAALSQRLQEARWFVRNIQQRFDTILRVARAIVAHQRNFFLHGELAMRPLVQRELAEELELHESTISRVTTAKYMATPRGTFELKYFFGSALGSEDGGQTSSIAARALIRQLVAAEDPATPLSDARLAELLKHQGIDCARRTVAKYREALKIPPTHLRKTR